MRLRAGAAEVVITPPVGTALDGYGGRAGGAVGVHDDLHACAVVFEDGATQAAVVSCDLVGVDRRLVAAIRERAEKATGIPGAHMMIAATHTHAGPAGLRREMDEALTEMMARTVAGAIASAHGQLRPAVLKAGEGSVDSVSQNRRDPAGPADDALRVLLFDSPDPRDGAIASILNFACHATVLYGTNMLISADYPGYAVRTVQRIVGDAPVVFLNGACGNVNPAWIEQRFEECERVGSIVGAEAARRLQELRPLGVQHKMWNIRWDEVVDQPVRSGELIAEPRIRIASRTIETPLRRLAPPEEYEATLAKFNAALGALPAGSIDERRAIMASITRFRTERELAARLRADRVHIMHPEVQAIGLGPGCAILGLPGEFFVESGRAVQDAAGIRHLSIACYANHYAGYFVPRSAFDEGGYEPGVSVLDETAEETARVAAIELLSEVA